MPMSSLIIWPPGQDGDVLEHGLAAVAEARCLHGRHLEAAAQLVDHQGRQRLALDVLGNDQERPAGLHHRFEQRQHALQRGELLLIDEDVGVFQLGQHFVGVGNKVGRNVAAVELHALDHLELGLEALGLFHRDHALVADFLHGLGNDFADFAIAIGRDGADLGNLVVGRHLLRLGLELLNHQVDGAVDTALQVHRIGASGDRLGAFADDRLRQHGCRRGAVAGDVRGLGGNLAQHLRAHVLELVFELDLLGDGHAILGDARRTIGFLEHDVAAFGAERHLNGIGQDIGAAQHALAGVLGELDIFAAIVWHLHVVAKGEPSRHF